MSKREMQWSVRWLAGTRALLALAPLLAAACSAKLPASGPVDMAHETMPPSGPTGDGGADDMARPPAVMLATSVQSILLRQGGDAQIPLTLTRAAGAHGAVTVTVDGMPAGVSAQPLTIAAGESAGALALSASPQAPQGGPVSLTLTATSGAASAKLAVDLYVAGAPGTVDQSYGSGGVVTVPNPAQHNDACTALALTPNGLPVLAGYSNPIPVSFTSELALATRLTDSGLPDPSFGDHGNSILPMPPDSLAFAVAVQPDGKTVLAGSGGPETDHDAGQVLFARLQSDGSLDSSFGSAGIVEINFSSDRDRARTIAVQPDGKIVALVYGYDTYVVRLDGSGAPDPSFGDKGIVDLTTVGKPAGFDALLLQDDGKIVVGGGSFTDRYYGQLLRLTAQGALDASFGTAGRTLISSPKGGTVDVQLLASAPDGSIVAAGTTSTAQDTGTFQVTVFHASRDGVLDLAFGADGYAARIAFPDRIEIPGAVAVQRDGKILVAGTGPNASGNNKITALARLDAHGDLDDTFGTQGELEVPDAVSGVIGGASDLGLAVDPLGRILVGGFASADGTLMTQDCTVLRVWP